MTISRITARGPRSVLVGLGALLLGGCMAGHYDPGKSAGLHELSGGMEVPPDSSSYSTASGSKGVRGGESAGEAKDLLESELAVRGDEAEPDAALAATAAWVLRGAYEKDESSTSVIAEVAQRFGFAGWMLGNATGSLGDARFRGFLKELVNQVPKNSPINRYGIVAGRGRDVVIVIGSVEASLDDFPRSVAPGGAIRLKGEIAERFRRASVFSTSPDGEVSELPMSDRNVDATVTFPSRGVYKLELLGYGSSGPVVIVNVPIHAGVEVPRSEATKAEVDPSLTVEQAEAKLLSLLNEERTKRGLGSVAPDDELRVVALAHSIDQVEHHFFGHVSPTTGGPDDRVRNAHIRVSKAGECVALEFTPAGAHRGLMDSPAHRASMLDANFTHVGVGVAFAEPIRGQRRLIATLLFGRRPSPEDARMSVEQVLETIRTQRAAQKLPAIQVDSVYVAAAGAGSRALASGAAKNAQQVLAAVGSEMQRQVNRARTNRSSCQLYVEIFDRQQFAEIPLLKRADIVRIGVGVTPLEDETGTKLGVVLIGDAGQGKTVHCN